MLTLSKRQVFRLAQIEGICRQHNIYWNEKETLDTYKDSSKGHIVILHYIPLKIC